MTGDLRINTDQLDEHRCHVAHVGQGIQMARDASVQVGVGDGAFGVLCSPFLVPPLSLVEGQARRARWTGCAVSWVLLWRILLLTKTSWHAPSTMR